LLLLQLRINLNTSIAWTRDLVNIAFAFPQAELWKFCIAEKTDHFQKVFADLCAELWKTRGEHKGTQHILG